MCVLFLVSYSGVRRPGVKLKFLKVIASFSILLFCFFVVSAQAAPQSSGQDSVISATAVSVPRFIRLSGRVKDDTGKPMAGITGITLAVYAGQEGGAALFLETQNVQLDAAGRLTGPLGACQHKGRDHRHHTSCLCRPGGWGGSVSGNPECATGRCRTVHGPAWCYQITGP